MHKLSYAFFKRLIGWLVKLLTCFEVVGRENMPRTGSLLVVTNHIHMFDPPILMCALPRRVVPLIAYKWRRKFFLGSLMASVGSITIHRGKVDRQALRKAFAALERGEALALAPEGTRSHTRAMQKARSGTAYIASRTGVPILPVGVSGTEKTFSSWKRLRRPKVRVVIGEPFTLPGAPKKARGKELERFTEQIMYRIADLLPEEYRGFYGGPRPAPAEPTSQTGDI